MWRSRLLFLAVFAATLLLIALYEDKSVGYTMLYALGLLALFSLVTVLAAPRLIRVEEQAEQGTIIKNEELTYRSNIVNRSPFFYPRMETAYHNPELLLYGGDGAVRLSSLTPRGAVREQHRIRFPYRGVYNLGVKSVAVTDILGLFRCFIPIEKPIAITVFPEGDEGFAWSVRNEPQNSALNTDLFNEDYSSVADVRKYTSSDSLRKVHWKLSAKRGELIVKNFHAYEPNRTILFLDTREISLGRREKAAFEDKMISYAASAIDYCMRGRLTADFIYGDGDRDSMVIEESGDLGEVYTHLAEIPFGGARSGLESTRHISGSYSMVIFHCGMDDATHDTIKDLVSFDHNILLYCFFSRDLPLDAEKQALLESLKAYGVGVNTVEIGGDAT